MTSIFDDIPDPEFEFGNSSIIHQMMLDGLRQMSNDIDDLENNEKKLTSRQWVKDRLMAFRANDNTQSRGYEFSGVNDFTGGINLKGSNVNLDTNSKLYLQSGAMIQTPNLTININELETLNNCSSNIQTQLNSKQNVINDNDLTISKISNLQNSLNSKQNTITNLTNITMGQLTTDTITCSGGLTIPSGKPLDIGDNSLNISKINNLQNSLNLKASSIDLTNGLNTKQNVIDSTHQIAENCITNLITDLESRPTLSQLNNGNLDLAINQLTVNQIIATNQTVQYSEMDISNNEIPQVKVNNLVDDLGTIRTDIINNNNQIIINQQNIDLKQNIINDGDLSISKISNLRQELDDLITISNFQSALDLKQNTIQNDDLSISQVYNLQNILDTKLTSSDLTNYQLNINDNNQITISNITDLQNALDLKQDIISDNNKIEISNINNLENQLNDKVDVSNFNIEYLGLGECNNTSDVNKPISILTQNALDLKQDIISDNNQIQISNVYDLQNQINNLSSGSGNVDLSNYQTLISDINQIQISNVNDLSNQLNNKLNSSELNNYQTLISDTNKIEISNINDLSNQLTTLTNSINSKTTLTAIRNADNNFIGTNSFQNINLNGSISCNGCYISPVELSFVDNVSSNIQEQLDNLQTSINGKQNSLSNSSYLDFTSSGQTQINTINTNLNNKQNTITTSSITDDLLNSTFLKPNNDIIIKSIGEKLTSISNNGTTNSYTLDLSTSSVFVFTTQPTANFTIRLNNCGTDTTRTINFGIIYNTTGKWYGNTITAYTNTSTQITLASSTPLYLGGTPSISTSTVMVQTFSLIRNFASNYVLSSVASYY